MAFGCPSQFREAAELTASYYFGFWLLAIAI